MRASSDRKSDGSGVVRKSGRIHHSSEDRDRDRITGGSDAGGTAIAVRTFAIDIGGTKFSAALFEDERMIARESRATDREGGRDWMLEQITGIGKLHEFDRCGIGF